MEYLNLDQSLEWSFWALLENNLFHPSMNGSENLVHPPHVPFISELPPIGEEAVSKMRILPNQPVDTYIPTIVMQELALGAELAYKMLQMHLQSSCSNLASMEKSTSADKSALGVVTSTCLCCFIAYE